jgi:quinol monooxygenase YgiN
MFYEQWESGELWQIHMNAPHLAVYMAATDGAVEAFSLNEMTKDI